MLGREAAKSLNEMVLAKRWEQEQVFTRWSLNDAQHPCCCVIGWLWSGRREPQEER